MEPMKQNPIDEVPTVRELKLGKLTYSQGKKYVGQKALLTCLHQATRAGRDSTPGVQMPVYIRDCRESYGNVDFLVQPFFGHGTKWVRASHNIKIVSEFTDAPETLGSDA